MEKKILLVLVIIINFNLYSQIAFEKGYFIDNSNQKIECIIKNSDWRYNPTDIEYKLYEGGEILKANLKNIAEFSIHNISKYIRSTVKIDKSSENINYLDNNKNPVFIVELLFLKVLVEGKTNLYIYENINLQRFFYNKGNSNIEQLVHKIYLNDDNILNNNMFKQQLWNDLKCPTIEIDKVEKLEYRKNSLINYFVEYNKCNNLDFTNYDKKVKKDLFNLTFRMHLNNSSLSIENALYKNSLVHFENKNSFGFGIETEFILPYNKNKWAILIEPTYQNFKSEKITDVDYVSGGKLITNLDYSSIEVPIGLRHYIFINTNSKIFVNASYIFAFDTKSFIDLKRVDNSYFKTLEIKPRNNLGVGLGFKFKDKYSFEIRFHTSKNILGDYLYWQSNYNTFAIMTGYSIF